MSDDGNENAVNPDDWLAAQMAQGDQAVAGAAEVARIIASFMKKLNEEGFNPYEQLELGKTYLATVLGGARS